MESCIFCAIAAGKNGYKIYEDAHFLAFLDIFPVAEGHTLVIPKKHYRWVWDVENIGEYFAVCQKIANQMRKVFAEDLIVSLIFGEAVHHAHIHLIPGRSELLDQMTNAERLHFADTEFQATVKKLAL